MAQSFEGFVYALHSFPFAQIRGMSLRDLLIRGFSSPLAFQILVELIVWCVMKLARHLRLISPE